MLELAETVLEVTGSASEIVFEPLPVDDPARRRPDITLATEVLGWRPEVDLREGLDPHLRVVPGESVSEGGMNDGDRATGSATGSSRSSSPSSTSATRSWRSCAGCGRSSCPSTARSWSSTTAATTAPATSSPSSRDSTVRVLRHPQNRGKGAAIRTGLEHVTGDLVLIQDADLEYDPEDWPRLLAPVLKGRAQVVYGSRFTGERRNMLFLHWVGNRFLSLVTNVLYNTTLSDMETCYKLFDRRVLDGIRLQADRFDFEPEITAKVLRQGIRIYEVPISYAGRELTRARRSPGRTASPPCGRSSSTGSST